MHIIQNNQLNSHKGSQTTVVPFLFNIITFNINFDFDSRSNPNSL